MIDNIFIANNNYYLNQFKFFKILCNKNTLIFYDEEIQLSNSRNSICIPSSLRIHSKTNVLKKIFKILETKKFIDQLNINLNENCCLYLGSDKPLFNQLFIDKYSFKSINVIDEGIGMYRKKFFSSYFLNYCYRFIFKLFLNINLYHVQPLGSHPRTNIVHLRRKDLLRYKRKNVKYVDIKFKKKLKVKLNEKVLILLPYDEKLKLNTNEIISHYNKIIGYFNSKRVIDLKPHPRDDIEYQNIFISKKICFIKKEILAEDIEIHNYNVIINYRSSSILNLVFENFDVRKIVTISFDKKHRNDNIYPNLCFYLDYTRIFDLLSNIIENEFSRGN